MKNLELIKTWESCYKISLGNMKSYKKRLKELETWDKPFGSPSIDTNGKWIEYTCKKIALQNLIS